MSEYRGKHMSKNEFDDIKRLYNAIKDLALELEFTKTEATLLFIAYHTYAIHQHIEQLVYKDEQQKGGE